jgi:hypothetical protein
MPKNSITIMNDKMNDLMTSLKKSHPDASDTFANMLTSLANNKPLKDVMRDVGDFYYNKMLVLNERRNKNEITNDDFNKTVSQYYTVINREVVAATRKYEALFETQNSIKVSLTMNLADKNRTFALTDYVCYLAGVSASGTSNRVTKTLIDVTNYISGNGSATKPKPATSHVPKPTKPTKEQIKLQEEKELTNKALVMIWQTNEGSITIKNDKNPKGSNVIDEIERVQPGFFKGRDDVRFKIKYLCSLPLPEFKALFDDYISSRARNNDGLFRGVSEAEYADLIKISQKGGAYSPDRYLSSTTDKNVAVDLGYQGKFVMMKGNTAYIPNRVYTSDEAEYLFPKDAKFRVTLSKDGVITLTEIPAGAAAKGSIQDLLTRKVLLESVAKNVSDIVSNHADDGAKVRFAPQSFLLSNDASRGLCDALAESFLFAMAEDPSSALKNTLLDDVFLLSQGLVLNATAQGRLPDSLAAQSQHFLDTLGQIASSADRTSTSLNDIIHTLVTAGNDLSLSLHTGNHALALVRRTVNGETRYSLYDPNIGELSLAPGQETDMTASLKSFMTDYLAEKVNGQSLADYYQTDMINGEYTFRVHTFTQEDASPELQDLKTLLESTSPESVKPPAVTPPLTLSPELNALLQSVPEKLTTFLQNKPSLDSAQNNIKAKAAAKDLFEKITAAVNPNGTALQRTITHMDVLPSDPAKPDEVMLNITYHDADNGEDVHVTVPVSTDEFDLSDITQSLPDDTDAQHFAEGYGLFLKSQSLYSMITSTIGLLGAINNGNTEGIAVNGVLLTMSVSDVTGLADKLADRFSNLLGITGTELFGEGLNGLLGKGASALAELAGLGAETAGSVGKLVADAPLLNSAAVGFSIYTDVENMLSATGEERDLDIGILTTDVVTGAISLGATVAATIGAIGSEAAGGIGGIAAAIGILIDVLIKPDNPLGLRDVINPKSEQIEAELKTMGALSTTNPQDLIAVRSVTDKNGANHEVLSFDVTAADLPTISTLQGDVRAAALLKYLAGLSTDDLEAYSADPTKLYATTEYADLTNNSHTWTEGNSPIDIMFANALNALSDAHVTDKMRLFYIVHPELVLPISEHTGYMEAVMDENGQGVTFGWTSPASYLGYVTQANGPETFNPKHVSLGTVADDIIMGTGSTQTLSFDYDNYGHMILSAYHEGIAPVGLKGDNSMDSVDLGYYVSNIASYDLDHHFKIMGNSRNNTFHSAWNNATQWYEYLVSGGAGNDTLFAGEYGQYTFDGGSDDGANGDTFVGAASTSPEYVLYDLSPNTKGDYAGLTWRSNFSVALNNVENIYGSSSNEVIHGSSGKNFIVTGGGNDIIWLSDGGDQYNVTGSVVFHGQQERQADAARDLVQLSDSDLSDLSISGANTFTIVTSSGTLSLDSQSMGQLSFITKDKYGFYYQPGQGWVVDMTANLVGASGSGLIPSIPNIFKSTSETVRIVSKDTDGNSLITSYKQGVLSQAVYQLGSNLSEMTFSSTAVPNDTDGTPDVSVMSNYHTISLNSTDVGKSVFTTRDGYKVYYQSGQGWVVDTTANLMDPSEGGLIQSFPDIFHNIPESVRVIRKDMLMNKLTAMYTQGHFSRALYEMSSNFADVSMNASTLYSQVKNLTGSTDPSHIEFVSFDGVSFHFASRADNELLLMVDNIDSATYSKFNNSSSFLDGRNGLALTGVNTLSVNLDGLLSGESEGDLLIKPVLGPSTNIFTFSVNYVLNAGNLLELFPEQEDGNLHVMLPGVNKGLTFTNFDNNAMTLAVSDNMNAQWIIHFSTNEKGMVFISQAVDQSGQNHMAIMSGELTAMYSGDSTTQTGVVIDLTQTAEVAVPLSLQLTDWKTTGGVEFTGNQMVMGASTTMRQNAGVLDPAAYYRLVVEMDAGQNALDGFTPSLEVNGHELGSSVQKKDMGNGHYQVTLTADGASLAEQGPLEVVLHEGGNELGIINSVQLQKLTEATMVNAQGDIQTASQVIGTAYADILSGNAADNTLYGGAGGDVLSSGGGNDLLVGGAGIDRYLVKSGDHVVISQQSNGTATDILVFDGVAPDALHAVIQGDDLVIMDDSRIAVLKDWSKGDTRYALGSWTDEQTAAWIKSELSLPGTLNGLQKTLQELIQSNLTPSGAGEAVPVPLQLTGWTSTGKYELSGNLLVLNGNGKVDSSIQQNAGVLDAAADYSLVVEMEAGQNALDGFTPSLEVNGHELGSSVQKKDMGDGYYQVTLTADGASLAERGPLTVVLHEEGNGAALISSVQLQKLTGAMATFHYVGGDANVAGSTDNLKQQLSPVMSPVA